ncbi:MAG TPA: beta-galactosidase, partial [Polyangiales bacterium]|nr:beta-galactosidase [Polyangiales bacterium]
LSLGKQRVPLHAGAVHYFRLSPNSWRPALEAVKSLGCNLVETYVPWGVHEVPDGSFDFGERDPSKNLARFLDTALSVGLYVFVRPGPNINAELTYFGLPRRIVFDPECQARSPRGQPLPFIAPPKMFPVPSYASERFLAETERWFEKVAEVVRPRAWPAGPVVLVQVDNEASFYFRDGPYDSDHHPDALTKYATHLRQRYGEIERLNRAYASEHASWGDVKPPASVPTTLEAARRSLDFMEFHEELIASALERMRDALARCMGELPSIHNTPMGESGLPTSLARLDRVVDANGLDYYHLRTHLEHVRDRTLHLVGSVRCPFSPEFGMGAPPWFALRTDGDSLQTLLCACAYGLRGMNLYMAVDRDRWYGAPFDEHGRDRELAPALRRLFAALASCDFHLLRRRVAIGVVLPKEYRELARSMHTLGAISPSLLALAGSGATAACHQATLGFAQPIQLAHAEFIARVAEALARAELPYVFVESDADETCLAELKVLITPSYEFASRLRWQRLRAFAANGGKVVYGPLLPGRDERFEPHDFVEPEGARLCAGDAESCRQLARELIQQLEFEPRFSASQGIDTTCHEDDSGPRVVFAIQRAAKFVQCEIQLPEPMALVDVISEERFEGQASVRVPMSGNSCRMLLCDRRERHERTERTSEPPGRRSEPPPGGRKKPSARRSDPPC